MTNYTLTDIKRIPRTVDSIPWEAADRQLVPIDLASRGYQEEEYFLSGTAHLYSLQESRAVIEKEDIPYRNRILVRRPSDPDRFHGRVVIELLNSTNGWDVSPMWSLLWPSLLEDGDIYIGLTIHPVSIAVMKRYNPDRYQSLSLKTGLTREVSHQVLCWEHCSPDTDFGFIWDILTQLGYYLKSADAAGLLGGPAERVYVVGCSQSAMFLSTYINVFHESSRPSPLRPPFDGYLPFTGSVMVPLTQHEDPPAVDDPIQVTHDCPVPVIRIMSQWDFRGFAGDLLHRRPDSDEEGDRFRLYEMAGQAHNPFDGALYRPGQEEMNTVGREALFPDPDMPDLPTAALVRQALRNLDAWSRGEKVPPRTKSRIEVDSEGKPCMDEHQNARGGLRFPQLSVPAATYISGTEQNPQNGRFLKFPEEKMRRLYGDREHYLRQLFAAIQDFAAEGFISVEDADTLKRKALLIF